MYWNVYCPHHLKIPAVHSNSLHRAGTGMSSPSSPAPPSFGAEGPQPLLVRHLGGLARGCANTADLEACTASAREVYVGGGWSDLAAGGEGAGELEGIEHGGVGALTSKGAGKGAGKGAASPMSVAPGRDRHCRTMRLSRLSRMTRWSPLAQLGEMAVDELWARVDGFCPS